MRKIELAQLRLGDRVDTIFGMGTVVCFEDHDVHARHVHQWLVSSFGGNGRIVVALDNPKAWSLASAANPHPYLYKSDIHSVQR